MAASSFNLLEWISGPVHSGKTTALASRIEKEPESYCGILAPVDELGQRYLQDIISGERRLLSAREDDSAIVAVGPYFFQEAVFEWGQMVLHQHHTRYSERTLVIDELGKLELRDAGLAPLCWQLLRERVRNGHHSLVIVRDFLLTEMQKRLAQELEREDFSQA